MTLPATDPSERDRNRKWVQHMAALLDTRWRIPYTNIRFGIDPIMGLLPVVGDAASAILSAVVIVVLMRLGVSNRAVVRMVGNLLLDMIVGCIPVLGSIFDVGFKANRRNLKLAEADLAAPR